MTDHSTIKTRKLLFTCIAFFFGFAVNSHAQRVKNETVEYQYLQLPSEPLNKTIQNYQSKVTQKYLEDNAEKRAQYEADMAAAQEKFDQEQAEYPELVAAAEKKYEEEMEEWNEKSIADKVIEKKVLNENNRPVKEVVPVPFLERIQEPKLQREYDSEALASTYLVLEGFNDAPDNAVQIEVEMYGFEATNPRVLSEVKNILKDGHTNKVTYYHVEYTYRHTMSVIVTNPDGSERFKLTPPELNNYTKFETKASTTRPTINAEGMLAMHEEEIMQNNLEFIRNLINDRMGFKRQPRSVELFLVKDKKGEYNDITEGFNLMNSGLNALFDNPENAKDQLNQAIALFESALKEADMNNKKARINDKVAIPLEFNLLECYFATGNIEKAKVLLADMNSQSMDRSERERKQEFETLITDTENRIQANQ